MYINIICLVIFDKLNIIFELVGDLIGGFLYLFPRVYKNTKPVIKFTTFTLFTKVTLLLALSTLLRYPYVIN